MIQRWYCNHLLINKFKKYIAWLSNKSANLMPYEPQALLWEWIYGSWSTRVTHGILGTWLTRRVFFWPLLQIDVVTWLSCHQKNVDGSGVYNVWTMSLIEKSVLLVTQVSLSCCLLEQGCNPGAPSPLKL